MTRTVTARDLRKRFRSEGSRSVDVLAGVSLDLHAGQMTALVGRSGSGKSTLLNIIGALSTPDAGEVEINGVDLRSLDSNGAARLRARNIGFVFQSFNLIPHLSAEQNIALPCIAGVREGRRIARSLLGKVGLEHRRTHRPGELSAGEQQRVALARALVNDPAVLLADEPTGNLDAETESTLLNLLRDLASEGRTIFVVTHNDAMAEAADVVLQMENGRISPPGAGDSSHSEFKPASTVEPRS